MPESYDGEKVVGYSKKQELGGDTREMLILDGGDIVYLLNGKVSTSSKFHEDE